MGKRVVVLLMICYMYPALGQDTLFSYFNRYFTGTDPVLWQSLVREENGRYFFIPDAASAQGTPNIINLYVLGESGEILSTYLLNDENKKKVFIHSYNLISNAMDELVLAYGSMDWSNLYDSDLSLIKFNTSGEALFDTTYTDTDNNEGILSIIESPDGSYYVGGWVEFFVAPLNYYLTHASVWKLDAAFNILWRKTYYVDYLNWTRAHSMNINSDGNIFVTCSYTPSKFHEIEDNESYNLWIDTEGNVINSILTSDEEFVTVGGLCKVLQNTGDILFFNRKYENDLFDNRIATICISNVSIDDGSESCISLAPEIDMDGNYYNYITSDGYLAQVSANNFYSINYYIDSTFYYKPFLIKYDLNLDTVFTKLIDVPAYGGYFIRDFQVSSDGGLLCSGYTDYGLVHSSFLIKMDTLGNVCHFVGECDSLVLDSITYISYPQDFDAGRYHLSTSPNPCTDHLTLSYNLPEEAENVWWRLYDINGIERRSLRLLDASGEREVTLRHCDPGLYLWRLSIGNRVVESGKLIIENE